MTNRLNIYSKEQTDTKLSSKQDRLVSGTNIKTINNQSLLGAGNINITGGSPNYRQLIINQNSTQSVNINVNSIIIGYCDGYTFSITGNTINEDRDIIRNIIQPNVTFYVDDTQESNTIIRNNETKTLHVTIIEF